jgi:hypothetical protein
MVTNNFAHVAGQPRQSRRRARSLNTAVQEAIASARAALPADASEDESWNAIVAALNALPASQRAARDGEYEDEEADADADEAAPGEEEEAATPAAPAVGSDQSPATMTNDKQTMQIATI